jgi:hypothetical protein
VIQKQAKSVNFEKSLGFAGLLASGFWSIKNIKEGFKNFFYYKKMVSENRTDDSGYQRFKPCGGCATCIEPILTTKYVNSKANAYFFLALPLALLGYLSIKLLNENNTDKKTICAASSGIMTSIIFTIINIFAYNSKKRISNLPQTSQEYERTVYSTCDKDSLLFGCTLTSKLIKSEANDILSNVVPSILLGLISYRLLTKA